MYAAPQDLHFDPDVIELAKQMHRVAKLWDNTSVMKKKAAVGFVAAHMEKYRRGIYAVAWGMLIVSLFVAFFIELPQEIAVIDGIMIGLSLVALIAVIVARRLNR